MDALMTLGELHMTLDPRLQQKRFGIRLHHHDKHTAHTPSPHLVVLPYDCEQHHEPDYWLRMLTSPSLT